MTWIRATVAVLFVLTGCAPPASTPVQPINPIVAQATLPTFTIDREMALAGLADRPNTLWQDTLLQSEEVKARRKLRKFKLSATQAAQSWTKGLLAASSNGVAYKHINTSFGTQAPQNGEVVYVLLDDGRIQRFDPANNGTEIGTAWTTLSGLTTPGTCTNTALMLTSDNRWVYFLTTGGYFVMVNANDGTRGAAIKLSDTSVGFSGIAPFVDYSTGGLTSSQAENIYCLARDGSIYRVVIPANLSALQVNAWRSMNGGTNGRDRAQNVTIALAAGSSLTMAAPTVTTYNLGLAAVNRNPADLCTSSPIVWAGQAFFGTGATGDAASRGYFVRFNVAAGTADKLQVSNFPILVTPAADFGPGFQLEEFFIPAGDRLHWIKADGTGITRTATSPPLVLDKTVAGNGNKNNGVLSGYTYTVGTTTTMNAADQTAVTAAAVPAGAGPSRWGGGAATVSEIDVGGRTWGAAYNQADDSVWVTESNTNQVTQINAATGTVGNAFNGAGNYAALVNVTNVGAGSQVCHGFPDPIDGGVWVAAYGTNRIVKIMPDCSIQVQFTTNIPSPTSIYYDTAGTPANRNDDYLWVASCPITGTKPNQVAGGALLKVKVQTAGNYDGSVQSFGKADANYSGGNRIRYYDNPITNANVPSNTEVSRTDLTNGSQWEITGPQGVAMDGAGRIWLANSLQETSQTHCDNCGANPVGFPFNIDGFPANGQSGDGGSRGSIVVFDPGVNKFRAVIETTGCPFNMEPYTKTGAYPDSMWVATYRYYQDTVARYNVTGTWGDNGSSDYDFKLLFESYRNTSNHWQPHWVAVDQTNNLTYVVNGNANTAYSGYAAMGMDVLKADATNMGATKRDTGGGRDDMRTGNTNYVRTLETGAQPRGVDVTSDGAVWVASAASATCVKYSSTGESLGVFPVGNTPWNVAVDKDDVAWVCNRTDGTVSRLPRTVKPPSPLNAPRGIAIDANQNMWIANSSRPNPNNSNSDVTVMDQTGNMPYTYSKTNITDADNNNTAQAIAINPNTGDGWAVSSTQNRGARFTHPASPNEPVRTTVNPTNSGGWDLTFLPNGTPFVSGIGRRYVRTGATFGTQIDVAQGNNLDPRGIDIDPANSGTAWVAINARNCVRAITVSNNNVGGEIMVGTGPTGVAVRDDMLWVVNNGGDSVTRLTAKTGAGKVGVGTPLETVPVGRDQPMSVVLDSNRNAWVTHQNDNRVAKVWFAGQQDLFAASNYKAGDGIASHMFLRFDIAANAFGLKTPGAAEILLQPKTTSARTSETLRTWVAEQTRPGDPSQLWTGFLGTNSVTTATRPVIGMEVGVKTGGLTSGTDVSIPLTVQALARIVDTPNTAVDASGHAAFAIQSENAALAEVAHYDLTTANKRPRLKVTLSSKGLANNTASLRSQPTLDSGNQRVYVMGSNVMFELRYTSAADFEDPSKIAYFYTQQGSSVGPFNGNNYVLPSGLSFLTESGRLATIDSNLAGTAMSLSGFNLGWSPLGSGFMLRTDNNTSQFTKYRDLAATYTNVQGTYDYDMGTLYMARGSNIEAIRLLN